MDGTNGKSVGIFSNTFWSIYNFRRSLVKRLLDEGYRVFAISAEDSYIKQVKELGCEIVVVKSFDAQSTAVFKEAGIIREIITILKDLPCEYIYTFTIKPNLYTALTTALTGKKVIITINGLGNVFSEAGFISKVSLQLFKSAFRRAGCVVFQNRDDYAFFKQKIGLSPEKVRFVRGSGVNVNEFASSKKQSPPGNQLVFLLACRLLKEKGIYEYISAAQKIKNLYPKVQFWLLGMEAKNPSAISMQELKAFDQEGIIRLLSQTDDVNGLLEQADVLVLPSFYNEGIPRILLEGLSKGMPIITTDSVGCRETVADGENGYLIQPRSTEALEEALERIIALPEEARDKMRRESRRMAESEFDENKVIDQYVSMIKETSPVMDSFSIKPLGAQ